MGIDLQRHFQAGVAHQCLGTFRVHPCIIEHGGVGVAELVGGERFNHLQGRGEGWLAVLILCAFLVPSPGADVQIA